MPTTMLLLNQYLQMSVIQLFIIIQLNFKYKIVFQNSRMYSL